MVDAQIQQWWWLILPLATIDIILKGVALWKAGQQKQLYWFIALLVINSAGVLPLIYLTWFQKKK